MLEPRLSEMLWCQGPMRLADTWCCLDCEALFTGLESCPSCASSAIWPLAAWLSPAQPSLLVVEAEDGTVLERSLTELKEGGYRFSDRAWKDLLEDYQVFSCR
jgi:hypothetical protein